MIEFLHSWLISHPIWQGVIINVIVGVALILFTIYWRLITAFIKVPPQRLGTWFQKARIAAIENRLYVLRRANDEPKFAVYVFIRKTIYCALVLTLILMPISANVIYLRRSVPPPIFEPEFALRLGSEVMQSPLGLFLYMLFPYYLFLLVAYRLATFAREYANFDLAEDRLLRRLNRWRKRLGEKPIASTLSRDETDDPSLGRHDSFWVGMQVLHPKYGQGRILDIKFIGEEEVLVANFENFGTKRLLRKFSQIKPL